MSVNHLAVDTIEYLQLKPIELNRLALNNVELPNEPFSRGVLSELSEFLYGQNYRFFEVYIRIDRLFTPYILLFYLLACYVSISAFAFMCPCIHVNMSILCKL